MAPDVFSTLPPQLGALARRSDAGLRTELRVLGIGLVVVGLPLAGFIIHYVIRAGRLWSPRNEEWLPILLGLGATVGGFALIRLSRSAGLIRGLFEKRLPQVTGVRLVSVRGKGRSGLWLVFDLEQKTSERILVGDNLPVTDAKAQALLRDARGVCPNASTTP
ncbi:MAG: hypothetical protein Q8L14_22740 [Myxococcales bacterium]|nr:hypothetical protein [Myxococcales bacterium]